MCVDQEFRVTWSIDVFAASAHEAAERARAAQRPETSALVFEVTDAAGEVEEIDLLGEAFD